MEKIVIADSDSLIALLNVDDANHTKAVGQLEKLISQEYRIIYPASSTTSGDSRPASN